MTPPFDKILRKLKLIPPKEHGGKDRKLSIALPLLGGALMAGLLVSAADRSAAPSPTTTPAPSDDEIVANLRGQIKGRGKEPAEAVYKNIKILKGKPAGAIL